MKDCKQDADETILQSFLTTSLTIKTEFVFSPPPPGRCSEQFEVLNNLLTLTSLMDAWSHKENTSLRPFFRAPQALTSIPPVGCRFSLYVIYLKISGLSSYLSDDTIEAVVSAAA